MQERCLEWVCVDFGPHILLPAELLPTWEGCNQPSAGRVVVTDYRVDRDLSRPATDYDLACSNAQAALSLIPVGNKHGLVLGDMDTMSTWFALEEGEGLDILIPLQHGGFEERVLIQVSREIPDEVLRATRLTVEVSAEGLALFGACDCGDFGYGGLIEIPASEGKYVVRTADFEPTPGDIVRIHRLRMAC